MLAGVRVVEEMSVCGTWRVENKYDLNLNAINTERDRERFHKKDKVKNYLLIFSSVLDTICSQITR